MLSPPRESLIDYWVVGWVEVTDPTFLASFFFQGKIYSISWFKIFIFFPSRVAGFNPYEFRESAGFEVGNCHLDSLLVAGCFDRFFPFGSFKGQVCFKIELFTIEKQGDFGRIK